MYNQYLNLKTPCYILDENKLGSMYDSLWNAFTEKWSNFCIGYSYKTNSLPWVIKYLKNKGAYAEVVSETEYELAVKVGYNNEKIILNGPCKGEYALQQVLDGGGIVNLDSFQEIEWLRNNMPKNITCWKVGMRINFDLEKECPNETIMGQEPGRFGFNIENGSFNKALEALKDIPHIKVVGVHAHHSTKTKSLQVFRAVAKKIVEVTADITDELEYVDIGGGFFGDKPNTPSFEEYAKAIGEILLMQFDPKKVKLIVEPGAALIASPFKYLCKAISEKSIKGRKFIGMNGSLIHLSPQMNRTRLTPEILAQGDKCSQIQVLSGFTCIEKDRIELDNEEIEIKTGDYILFHNVGAYTMALSPLFIQYYPEVYVEREGQVLLARKAWAVEEYITKCFIQ